MPFFAFALALATASPTAHTASASACESLARSSLAGTTITTAEVVSWVEEGRAPPSVLAVHRTDGRRDRSRPLCPYPATAVYKGRDDTNDAASFECRER